MDSKSVLATGVHTAARGNASPVSMAAASAADEKMPWHTCQHLPTGGPGDQDRPLLTPEVLLVR